MSLIQYKEFRFSPAVERVIEQANDIIEEYEAEGFVLTLRQLYYQFVSRDLIANTPQEYKRLGDIINKGRLAGLVSWAALEDRTRNLRDLAHWGDPKEIVQAARDSYRIDLWETQPVRVEVWVEKDALVGVIEGVCQRNDVPFFACRGYASQSELWRAGQRISQRLDESGQPTAVLHLGDHDPSGIDMTRDNRDRLAMFVGEDVLVQRLALNMDQVRRYGPPPNPAKDTDSRAGQLQPDGSYTPGSYRDRFGHSSWELDALEPRVIAQLIQGAIDAVRDANAWEAALARQEAERARLNDLLAGL